MIGATGHPAITFAIDADNRLKAKFSTFLHGDGGTNDPILYSGTGRIDIAIYNSAFNASLDASDFYNIVSQPNNTISPEIYF